MDYEQQVITFITYEEYIHLQDLIGDSQVAQYELADAILIIYETMQFGKSKSKLDPFRLDVSR